MYAMLTGCLPYTVEPFNITALHAKMLENKMNPIPDHLSESKHNHYTFIIKGSIFHEFAPQLSMPRNFYSKQYNICVILEFSLNLYPQNS